MDERLMIDPIVYLLLIIRSSHISASAFSKQEILISCCYIYIYPGQLASPSSIPAGAYEFVLFVSAPIPILSVVADPPSPSHSELFSPPTPPPPDRD